MQPPPEEPAKKTTKTVTTIETLNDPKPHSVPAPSATLPSTSTDVATEEAMEEASDDEDEEEDGGKIKDPAAAQFAVAKSLDESFSIIQQYPYLVSEKVADDILAAAFSAQYKEKPADVKKMVFQSTILSYCMKLSVGGKDGVALFFKRCVASFSVVGLPRFDDSIFQSRGGQERTGVPRIRYGRDGGLRPDCGSDPGAAGERRKGSRRGAETLPSEI
jgi:hypothetical protein